MQKTSVRNDPLGGEGAPAQQELIEVSVTVKW